MQCDGSVLFVTTIQEGKGIAMSWCELAGSPMCPVRVFRSFLALRPTGPIPLLVHADGTFLFRYRFIQVFRCCLTSLGFEAKDYCSHSFRIGAATEAARWRLGPDLVKRIGRWESDRYKLYVRPHLL